MRVALFYSPRLLIERLAEISLQRRRLRRLRGSVGAGLRGAHLDSLELLELAHLVVPRIIYDIGSNVGTWTLLAKSLYSTAEIHGFEPLGWHCKEYLRATFALEGVVLHQVALGSMHGQFDMQVPNQSDSSSLLPLARASEEVFNLRFDKSIPVTVERLDEYVEKKHLPLPDLIKLDVQGFECEVLNGGMLALQHAKAIITEVSFKEFYKGQCRFDQLVTLLAQSGFFLYAFGMRTAVGRPLDQCDVLFLKSAVGS